MITASAAMTIASILISARAIQLTIRTELRLRRMERRRRDKDCTILGGDLR